MKYLSHLITELTKTGLDKKTAKRKARRLILDKQKELNQVEKQVRRQWRKDNNIAVPPNQSTQHAYYNRTYNISLFEFQQREFEQQHKCAICMNPFNKKPVVDHDHKTGAVRGLLCQQCNSGLGMFKDKIVTLKRAIKYLEIFQET